MKNKEKQNISMKEMLTKRSFEPITNCNCRKDKQVEEMAKDMADCKTTCNECFEQLESIMTMEIKERENHCQAYHYAKRLYEHGYRNFPEDSIVLSKDKFNDEIHFASRKGYDQGSKETAEKYKVAMILYIQEMQKYLELNEEQAKILYHHNNEIAKQFEDAITDPFWFCSFGGCEGVCKECKDTCEMSIFVKERKETVEKFANEVYKELYQLGKIYALPETLDADKYGIFSLTQEVVAKIAKEQFGVGIKE